MNALDWRDKMVKAVLEVIVLPQESWPTCLSRAFEHVAQEVVREISRAESGYIDSEAQARQARIDKTARALLVVGVENGRFSTDHAYGFARDLEHARERHLERERADREAEAQRRGGR